MRMEEVGTEGRTDNVKMCHQAEREWLILVILATWEGHSSRTAQTVFVTPSPK
jgi:hypothetical protein